MTITAVINPNYMTLQDEHGNHVAAIFFKEEDNHDITLTIDVCEERGLNIRIP
jgi:hypothetical protein